MLQIKKYILDLRILLINYIVCPLGYVILQCVLYEYLAKGAGNFMHLLNSEQL